MKEITPQRLKSMIDAKKTLQIIDIRELHEYEAGNLGGMHIPMAQVLESCDKIRKDCPVIIHCQSGNRGKAMVYVLETQKGFNNLFHLKGGIEGWAEEIDPKILEY